MKGRGKGRDQYQWADAVQDLALSCPITLGEAGRIMDGIRRTGHDDLHPFDAYPLVATIINGTSHRHLGYVRASEVYRPDEVGEALGRLSRIAATDADAT